MTLLEVIIKSKEYLWHDSNLPGVADDYKLVKDLQYRLSRAVSRLEKAHATIDDRTLYSLLESWLMMNPTRSSLQWDISKEAFKKYVSGE